MLPAEQEGKALIDKYNSICHGVAKYEVYKRAVWEFLRIFSESDFELVLKWLIKENARNDFKRSLELRKLLSDSERFNDLLSLATEAQTRIKNKTRTPKEQTLFESRRADEPQPVKPPVKVSAEFLADSIRNLKQLQ